LKMNRTRAIILWFVGSTLAGTLYNWMIKGPQMGISTLYVCVFLVAPVVLFGFFVTQNVDKEPAEDAKK